MALNMVDAKRLLGGKSGRSYKRILAKSDRRVLWSAGSTVTYYVNTGVSYSVEVDNGSDVLNPTTFTPALDGWMFVGWREDSTASADVLTEKVMDSEPITLYAVFSKDITAWFFSGSASESQAKVTGTRFYNNGTVANATITVPAGASIPGWEWRGWSGNKVTAADAPVIYANGAVISNVNADVTLRGLYQKIVTANFISGYDGSSPATGSGIAYYNSSSERKFADITFPTGASADGWTWRGWSQWWDDAANAEVTYANGDVLAVNPDNDGITFYGLYQKTVTVSYNGNGATGGSVTAQKDTMYHNSAQNTFIPTFILASNSFSKTYHAFRNWAIGSASGDQYAAGASVALNANTTFYAVWTANTWYMFQNNTWTDGWTGWTCESGTSENWSVSAYGLQNNNDWGLDGTFITDLYDLRGCKTIEISITNANFSNNTSLAIRGNNGATIATITSTGTHTITVPDAVTSIRLAGYVWSGCHIYYDYIKCSA